MGDQQTLEAILEELVKIKKATWRLGDQIREGFVIKFGDFIGRLETVEEKLESLESSAKEEKL